VSGGSPSHAIALGTRVVSGKRCRDYDGEKETFYSGFPPLWGVGGSGNLDNMEFGDDLGKVGRRQKFGRSRQKSRGISLVGERKTSSFPAVDTVIGFRFLYLDGDRYGIIFMEK